MIYNSRIPIYLQVIDDLKKRIIKEELKPGDKLPSTRELAIEYEVNPNTVARIYKEMEQMNICYVDRGKGTFINDNDELLPNLRAEVIGNLVDSFVDQMNELGFSRQEIINKIKSKEIE
jgi:DNA-binding transcriptional regulator YhcF (GntR family)